MSEVVKWSEVRALGNLAASDISYLPSLPLTAVNVQNAIYQLQQLLRTPVGGATISETKPLNAYPGQLWWDNSDGTLYIFYIDSNGSQWVELNTTP